jgi:hypothetical protein
MKEANRNTVYTREPAEEIGLPYSFEGNIVAEGKESTDTANHHTRVYDTFDGYYLLEHSNQSLVEGEPLGDRFDIVPASRLRTAVIMNCTNAIALQIGDQMGLDITGEDFIIPSPPPPEG